MIEKQMNERKKRIIVFKTKESRADKKSDKTEILQQSVGPKLNFVDVGACELGHRIPDDPENIVALDINDHELPMVFAALTDKEVSTISKDPNISSVELDGLVYAQNFNFAMPQTGGLFQGLDVAPPQPSASGGPSAQSEIIPWGVSRIKAPMCWEATQAKGIYVAVIDTGIWPHNDLLGNLIGGISFVPGESWIDNNGHGTHVAGTIAARINGFGVVGVAPAAYLYAIKVLDHNGEGQWSWLMSGLYWMRKYYGCTFSVANMSLGGTSAPTALEAYINYAAETTLLVAAAGNYRPPAPNNSVMYPAKYAKCLAVSAIDSSNNIAGFSARGPEVQLCAPGVDIPSTLPGNGYGYLSGTSMAAPHVTGAAALCKGTHRGNDVNQIRQILVQTADDLGSPGKDDLYGYGLVDCNNATFWKICG